MTELSRDTERLAKLRHPFSQVFPDKVNLDFTVVIPTYNGASRLPALLECLKWQINVSDLDWEILVIDNNSTDDTAQLVEQYQAKWPQHIPLRYILETCQGAGHARNRGMREARSPVVGFLDDDNLPGMTWVTAAHRFGQEHPKAGVYGSRIQGEFETDPPANFERIAAFLAITERGAQPLLYDPEKKVLPPGAGMVARRKPWIESVPDDLVLAQKIGDREAGEDLEVVLHIQNAGWEVWYNPHMRVSHRIPSQRLKRDYLITLCRGIGLSRFYTRMLSFKPWQRPLALPVYILNDGRKLLTHILHHRMTPMQDTVAACELTLYWFSLLSPFFMAYRTIKQNFIPLVQLKTGQLKTNPLNKREKEIKQAS